MLNILLVGAGQLGSRHLQSFALLKTPCHMYVIEPNDASRVRAKERWDEVNKDNHHLITFCNFDDVRSLKLDAAIIATLSIGRLNILKMVCELSVQHILCEKTAFQSISDYEAAISTAAEKKVNVRLNYSYRLSETIKHYLTLVKPPIDIEIIGSNVELGCNLIHYLDLFSLFNSTKVTELEVPQLLIEDNNTRSTSLKSFYGLVEGKAENGAAFKASFSNESNLDYQIIFSSQKEIAVINESQGHFSVGNEKVEFNIPYASKTTAFEVLEMLKGKSSLPTLQDSYLNNSLLLNAINCHIYPEVTKDCICPIT
ncbi:Gfo/Idh/MocA family oxidoreductase [Catenovulum sp. SM1970]|uniref:Gfo/Idh/MocA family oxidoreductase n=1 Tax=Marinifaba aquimaris TaxID=2741323 RepID=UPI0015739B48|nr:Gfo/Idh/MocA family oxidoreductase [Marinifaba aquimaris]NTS75357.1 Gfo/Idh/MocA family oxidoreductase [Marinifaba aquimaris]